MAFHYFDPQSLLPKGVKPSPRVDNFPLACARLLRSKSVGQSSRALDLGCAVGRSSFELARFVSTVVGIDFSRSFIRAANQLQKKGMIKFRLREEGNATRPVVARVPPKIDRARVSFRKGDALHLPKNLGSFDLVLAANLIDRLPDPKKFLAKLLPDLVSPKGHLLLTSPYTWTSEYTPKSKWFQDSFATLKKLLRPHFRLIHRQHLPFILREHRRKFQYTFADATLWQKI